MAFYIFIIEGALEAYFTIVFSQKPFLEGWPTLLSLKSIFPLNSSWNTELLVQGAKTINES